MVEFQPSTEPTLGSTWHSLTGFSSDLNWDSSLAFMADGIGWPRAHFWAKALLQQGFFAKTPLECHENHYWYLLVTKEVQRTWMPVRWIRFISIFPYIPYTNTIYSRLVYDMQRQELVPKSVTNETKSGNPRVGQEWLSMVIHQYIYISRYDYIYNNQGTCI